MTLRIAVVLMATILAFPVLAQTPSEGGRFVLEKTEDGYLRLDRQTGDMSVCRNEDGTWACRAVADDRAAFEDEIERLGGEIAALRDDLERARKSNENSVELPSREDLDEMMGFMEDAFTRFKGMVDRLNREPLTPPAPVPDDPSTPDRT